MPLSSEATLPTPDQVWHSIELHCSALCAAERPLSEALGRVLAEPIVADRDLPPTDRAAMDGYAVHAADLRSAPVRLPVVGEVAAGSERVPRLERGTCVGIFTGATIPDGADAVVMLEHTRSPEPGVVEFSNTPRPGDNVFRQGEDARAGDLLLPPGQLLAAAPIAVCSAVGRSRVLVHHRPRVAVMTIGRELVGCEISAEPHQIRDTNGPLMASALTEAGMEVVIRSRAADDPHELEAELSQALAACDAVVLSGGVSVGKYDFVPEAVARVGARIVVHGVAMKPGKPFLFALSRDGKLIFGLPGNPLSTTTTLYEFVLPALRRLSGSPPEACRPTLYARLGRQVLPKGGRHRFQPARLAWTASGPWLEPIESRSSADLVAAGRADGAMALPPTRAPLEEGTLVAFRPWKSWP